MAKFQEGQSVVVVGDQTQHELPIGSVQKIYTVEHVVGLPAYAIIDETHALPVRWLIEEDIKSLDIFKA